MKYPNIDDSDFYQKINNIFSKYKIKDSNKSLKELCFPKRFKLQNPQKFVAEYLSPKTPYNALLIFHQIGSGKTCAAVNIAEKWKHRRNIIVTTPASLIGNFKKELVSYCPKDNYITDKEKEVIDKVKVGSKEYLEVVQKCEKRIAKYYNIMSHHKFVKESLQNKIKLKNSVLIVDEVQNIVSEKGLFYNRFFKEIKKADDLIIILMSATPMFDKPIELGLTLNLLPIKRQIPMGEEFNKLFLKKVLDSDKNITYIPKNINLLKNLCQGFISYYRGADSITYPKVKTHIINCKFSLFQYQSYLTVMKKEGRFQRADILNMPSNFLLGPRMISNIAFPNKKKGSDGLKSLSEECIKNIKIYSIKFYQILRRIKKSRGTIFIYSNFKKQSGIESFAKCLEHRGYYNYVKHGPGKNRFAIFSGDVPLAKRNIFIKEFNQYSNRDGDKIKIILGTPAIKEGISLLRVEQLHIIEYYWNFSRMAQIIGRAIRYCSHRDMPRYRQKVDLFVYYTSHPQEEETIEEYIISLVRKKKEIISNFEHLLKEVAVDCRLNKKANNRKGDKKISCA